MKIISGKNLILAGLGVVVIVIAGYFLYPQNKNSGGIACTMEAKLCPDGSYVGRTGPKCEFAACPVPKGPLILNAGIGKEVSGLDVAITPIAVTEDSRCPSDVQCIWAGTVKVRVNVRSGLGASAMTFELNKPITTEAEQITLLDVSPQPKAGIKINDSEYLFRFEVAKR